MNWIALHVHSQYSILDSTASVKQIAKKAKDYGMPYVACTDSGNMYGVVDFFKACLSVGVKPIIGCELWVAKTSRFEKKRMIGSPHAYPIILLVKNDKGYRNLCKLSSLGFLEGFYYYPRIDKELLEKHKEGLICLSGSISGSVPYLCLNGTDEEINEEVNWYKNCFGDDYYFELQRHKMDDVYLKRDGITKETWILNKYDSYVQNQEKVIKKLLKLSKTFNISCVATNDSHYINREDWPAHEILLNIQSGEPCEIWERDSRGNAKNRIPNPKRKVYSSHEFYFKSPKEMESLFSDIPKAIENTLKVAEKCFFEFDFTTKHYPVYIPPTIEGKQLSQEERQKAASDYLYKLCNDAISHRYTEKQLEKVKEKYPDKDPLDVVKQRMNYEFEIIDSKGMCDYLLIVYDFISWAKSRNIAVGPGRGSAAGSVLSYLVGITDIEPLQFSLFFERFINPERVSYPDIDVDICMDRRPEVIDYTISKYGKDRIAQIITFGTMKAKMAIKDVGRVLSVPLAKVNAIAKLVPEDPNMTLEKALIMDHELNKTYEEDEEARIIIDMAKRIEGSFRNISTHAAGLIISASPITKHLPVCIAKDSQMLVTQFSMKPVEAIGMLKIDFLGLKTLTSIEKAVSFVKKNWNKEIVWNELPLDDEKTFNLLQQGKTLGVFQLESSGMQELARQLHIDNFEEIIAVGALYRPGPMDMIPSFINRKHGKEAIEIDHPQMKEILKETYGVMVYQEQVMQIASKLAGYSLGEGDVLRRAIGKKDLSEMKKQRQKFILGAKENQIDTIVAENIFGKIEKFASYGFNKSHATAYAYLSYTTAYLKANFPTEWMAALMTCDRDDLTKVAKFIGESSSMSIPILPPDVNEAGIEFIPTKKGIRFAMNGIKGVGQGVVEAIIEERKNKGKFTSLYDFIRRIDTSRVGKKNIEVLIEAGSFDFTKWSRDAMRQSLDAMYEQASREQKEASKGVLNLFSLLDGEKDSQFSTPPKVIHNNSSLLDILKKEKELLGFYLTSHPMESYQKVLKKLSCVPLKEIEKLPDGSVIRCAFIIDIAKTKIASKTQKKFAILTISDGLVRFELPIWSDLYEEKSYLLEDNQMLYAVLVIDRSQEHLRLHCKWLDDLTKTDDEMIKKCDEAFEIAKNFNQRRKTKKNGYPMQKKEKRLIKFSFNMDLLKHSHLVHLKKLFRENPGDISVELIFNALGNKIATLAIDSKWGISWDNDIERKIHSIESFMKQEI